MTDREVHLLPESVWNTTIDVNLTGVFHVCKSTVATILEGGHRASVVIIGSPTGYFGGELGHHAYSASKGGLVGLGRVMANEYIGRGIRVNLVWPGLIDTPMNEFITSDAAVFDREMAQIPSRRPGRPGEIASMVRFLLSDEASYCVGGIFTVDGGLTSV
jgi:NAD(P)-dependent dehydrogenase (short-subunit alcohol dehydrogenase family)